MSMLTYPFNRKPKPLWLGALGATLAVGVGVYAHYRRQITYALKLLNVQRVAWQFYRGYKGLHKHLPYGSSPTQKLDVYRPLSGDNYPVVIYVYGGAWNSGNKELYAPAAQRFLAQGFVTVIINYTLNPFATYRQQTAEVALALDWTFKHIHAYGGDPQRIFIGGQSAGAHLSALALCDPQWLQTHAREAAHVRGYFGISGPYDINLLWAAEQAKGRDTPLLRRVFESQVNYGNASPITHVRAGLPPFLLIHGDADKVVPFNISQAFHDRLQTVGVRSELLIYPNAGHSGLLFDALATDPSRLVVDLAAFIRTHAQQ